MHRVRDGGGVNLAERDKLQAERDQATLFVALAAGHHLAALAYLRRAERLWKTELRKWPAVTSGRRRRPGTEEASHPLHSARNDVARAEGKLLGRLFRMEELSLELRLAFDAYFKARAA